MSGGIDLRHPCPAPGCARQISLDRYACPADWKRLPADHKLAIARAWGRRTRGAPGAIQEHQDATAAADQWLADHSPGATP